MHGIDVLPDINALPEFYVQCEYDNAGKLIGFYTVTKLTWDAYHNKRHYSVVEQNGRTFLFLGAGKERNGYTRSLFQKKAYASDSALIIHDTLLYKTTTPGYIRVQFFTNIGSDSIPFEEMYFYFTTKKDLQNSIFASYDLYRGWFNRSEMASQIIGGVIKLKSDTILTKNIIKTNGYINVLDIIKNKDFEDRPTMPVTLFWLKDSGLLY